MKKIKFSLPTPKELISVQPHLAEWSQSWAFWPLEEVLKSLSHEDCFITVATQGALNGQDAKEMEQKQELVGFSFLKYVLEDAELLFVFVPEAKRGLGVARQLLEFSLAHLSSLGVKRVSLEVRPSNLTAIRLYSNLGFSILSKRDRYYRDGESALVFSKELP